ncbi:MAG: nucleotidyltransferase domain-containing protein [Anaerolineales bacterium]|nr:nucleotidyltransferase domain-containing protein [Anaerolineales bacterium]
MVIDKLLGTSHARVYRHLAKNLGVSFMEAEIVSGTGVSRSAVNLAVRDLAKRGFIDCEKRGRTRFYSADPSDLVVRQFKVWEKTLILQPVVDQLRPLARRVVLFGSAAEGLDTAESDLDLFIVAPNRKSVRAALMQTVEGQRIQAVIVSEQELAVLKSEDPTFFARVQQGLILLQDGNA